ncbi:hypothetical protein B6I21_05765 [candidate division KSB1 bacterium 4572_119]|nr:MAG: hypothetical protein B6I21_05765 [candidate division KSB1 bacterium 4572_119]
MPETIFFIKSLMEGIRTVDYPTNQIANNKATPAQNPTSLNTITGSFANTSTSPYTIAVGSGKGGVGKTFMCASIAFRLAEQNKTVTIIDMDLGSPSLHTFFKVKPNLTIKEFIFNSNLDINDLACETAHNNIKIICGSPETLGLSHRYDLILPRLNKNINMLNSDYIIFDLGSGLNLFDIEIFIDADEKILVGTPEPAVILDNFNFLKLCILKTLERLFSNQPEKLKVIKQSYTKPTEKNNRVIKSLICDLDGKSKTSIKNNALKFFPKFILNMVHDESDFPFASSVAIALRDMFNIDVKQLGTIPFSTELRDSIKNNSLEDIFKQFFETNEAYANVTNGIILNSLQRADLDSKLLTRKQYRKNRLNCSASRFICSSKCSLWNNCTYQRGGYPCKIKYIGFINSN